MDARLTGSILDDRRRISWYRTPAVVVAVTLLAGLLSACGSSSGASPALPASASPDSPLLVLAGPEATGWERLLRAGGIAAQVGPPDLLSQTRSAVLPDGSGLDPTQENDLLRWVDGGGRLVTADRPVLARLGGTFSAPAEMNGATMAGEPTATWAAPLSIPALRPPAGSTGSRVLASAVTTKAPLIVEWGQGEGRVTGLAVDPLGSGRDGYELFPGLAGVVAQVTAAPAGPTRDTAQVYLDPGDLSSGGKGVDETPEQIAASLQGVRVVDIAGWNFDFGDPADDYPYGQLIADLHARGILAYAWLEPPFVTLHMWDTYPSCREKTENGQDAFVGWRRLESLETPVCFQIAWKEWDQLLTSFPWDGVNVAELYFEPPGNPAAYTPFSPGALALFGRSPAADPAGFAQFRTNLVTQLNAEMLAELNGLPDARSLQFQLTVIDDYLDPNLGVGVGSDTAALAQVAAHGGATLEVEAPFTTWEDGPLTYGRLAQEVTPRSPPGASLLDLNVVDRSGAHPTAAMTGGELDLAVEAAAEPAGRVAVYSLGTMTPADLAALPAAVAGAASVTVSSVDAPWPVTVHAPNPAAATRLLVDGHPWPVADGQAIVPSGSHTLRWSAGPPAGPGLDRLTGDLGTASVTSTTVTFTYSSRGRAYAVVTDRPSSVSLDHAVSPVPVEADPGGGWVLQLPPGDHAVTVSTG